MSFYADQKYYARDFVPIIFSTISATGTGTNVGAVYPPAGATPTFIKKTLVTNVQVQCITAPAGGFTGGVLTLLNGTNTLAVATYSGGTANATAGGLATVVLTSSNGTFGSSSALTGTLVGTCTSAGVLAGGFGIWLETQELYDSSNG